MPQSEEAGWDHTQRAEDGGAWSSILAPAREVFAPSAGRSSWVSGTKGGVDDADASAAEDYEVESQMLEPLAERRERRQRGGVNLRVVGRLRAVAKRKQNLAALGGAAAVLLVSGIIYGSSMSSYGEASALSLSMQHDETGNNDVGQWTPWALAVSKMFLRHRAPAVDADQETAARECARRGWPEECTAIVFSDHGGEAQSLASIEHNRRALEKEYSHAVEGVRPLEQELRLPAGVGLEFREKAARAALHVCEIPPEDGQCIIARKEEVEAIKVLRSELVEAMRRVEGSGIAQLEAGLGKAGHGGSTAVLIRKIAELVFAQRAPDMISQSTWRTLNAVTAVVLHETLEDVEGRAVRHFDMLLHPDTGLVAYVGAFRGLRYDGRGVLFYRDGSVVYAGEFRDGLFHGRGVLKSAAGDVVWKGDFAQGEPVRSIL